MFLASCGILRAKTFNLSGQSCTGPANACSDAIYLEPTHPDTQDTGGGLVHLSLPDEKHLPRRGQTGSVAFLLNHIYSTPDPKTCCPFLALALLITGHCCSGRCFFQSVSFLLCMKSDYQLLFRLLYSEYVMYRSGSHCIRELWNGHVMTT